MSSQAFALNLRAPFFPHPEWLRPIFGEQVEAVLDVQAEVAGPANDFNEPGTRGARRTTADLGVRVRVRDGATALLLLEVKLAESGFGECGKPSTAKKTSSAPGVRVRLPCATGTWGRDREPFAGACRSVLRVSGRLRDGCRAGGVIGVPQTDHTAAVSFDAFA